MLVCGSRGVSAFSFFEGSVFCYLLNFFWIICTSTAICICTAVASCWERGRAPPRFSCRRPGFSFFDTEIKINTKSSTNIQEKIQKKKYTQNPELIFRDTKEKSHKVLGSTNIPITANLQRRERERLALSCPRPLTRVSSFW